MTRPSNTQMHEQPNSSDHDRHDLLAVAALADRDATGEEAVRARAQVDTCTECASLHAELVSLASATRHASGHAATARFPAPAGGRPATAPEPDPSSVRVIRDGPRRFQPAVGAGSHDARPCWPAVRGPARHAVIRWRCERPRRGGGGVGPAAGDPADAGRGCCRFSSAGSAGSGRRPRARSRARAHPRRSRARARNRQRAWTSTTATGRSPSRHQQLWTRSTSATSPGKVKASPRSPRIRPASRC